MTMNMAGRDLHLQAEFGPYLLDFDLELAPDRGDAAMLLGQAYPIITERYGVHRSARVRPGHGEVRVWERRGRLEGLRVVDLSTTGLALHGRAAARLRPGMGLRELSLGLGEDLVLPLPARVVRAQSLGQEDRLALRFEPMARVSRQALARFVFERHSHFGRRGAPQGDGMSVTSTR